MLSQFALFGFGLLMGLIMVAEGCAILLFKRAIVPLPAQVLYGVSALVSGRQAAQRRFAGRQTPKGLRDYAVAVLIFGPLLVLASLLYLNSTLIR